MRQAVLQLLIKKSIARPSQHPTAFTIRRLFLSASTSTAVLPQNMKFGCCCYTLSAVAAAMLPLRGKAWMSPSVSLHRRVVLVSASSSSSSRVSSSTRCRMSSTSLPSVEESSSSSSAKKAATTTTTTAAAGMMGKAIAEGTIVTQFPGGMTAVRINEDLTDAAAAADSGDSNNNNKNQVRPAVIGVTPEFLAASKNSASSGDYQGKQVVFPNGSTGVVVAHRPPLIFCYSAATTASDQISAAAVGENDDGMVQVMDSMAKITVSPEIHQVDCFGRDAIVDDDDDNKSPSTGTTTATTITNTEEDDDSSSSNNSLEERAIFAPIPQVAHIALINNPMLTGNTMMDTLAPVGRGQNMLLIGSDLAQMRGLAVDFLRTQLRCTTTGDSSIRGSGSSRSSGGTRCVYASTDSDREAALKRLQDAGIADEVHFVGTKQAGHPKNDASAVIVSDEVSRAAEAVLIASTACAIGESYALQKGMHALVVIDNIDLHKKLWDATTRVLVDVFGIDAVVKSDRDGGASSEMRSFYSTLIQRAGQYNKKRGGGSVTLLLLTSIPTAHADTDDVVFQPSDFDQGSERMKERISLLVKKGIPLTASTLRKISIPIPTVSEGARRLVLQHIDDLISMSDGQVWLDETLASSGQQPPMDPQRSITRIGIGADTQSRADAPAIRRIAEGMRLELSQAASMVGTEATAASRKQIRRQQALLLAMHQPAGSGGRRLSESCTVLLAAKQGFLDQSIDDGALPGTKEGDAVMKKLMEHVQSTAPDIMHEIDESLDISEKGRSALTASIASFFET